MLPETRATLLYSAKSAEELVFRSDLDLVCRRLGDNAGLAVRYFVTDTDSYRPAQTSFAKASRLGRQDLAEALAEFGGLGQKVSIKVYRVNQI